MNNKYEEINKIIEEYLCDEDLENVPESVKTKYAQISKKLPDNSEQQSKANSLSSGCEKGVKDNGKIKTKANTTVVAANSLIKKTLIVVFLVMIMIAAVVLPIFLYPKAPAPSYQYTDRDLVMKQTSLSHISDTYDILLPSDEFFIDEQFNSYDIAISNLNGEEKEVYLYLNFFSLEYFDDLHIVVVLVDNYDYTYKSEYENLSESASTEKFNYNYEVYSSDNSISKAYFICGDYKYYIDLYNTAEPERITTILNALS